MSNQVAVSPLGPERADDVRRLDQLAFAFGADDVNADFVTAALEWDRVFGATVDADPELAGIYAVYSLGLSVPTGGWGAAVAPVPMAGVSWVAVHPGRRRRGVASAMIRHHLHGVHESGGEAVSGLHASEPAIYGRFGYGLATSGHRLTVARGAALRAVAGADQVSVDMHTADPQQHTELLTGLDEEMADRRPGLIRRSPGLRGRELVDWPGRRAGREPLRVVVARRGGRATGYALLRREVQFEGSNATGSAKIDALVALDAATARALWGFVTDLDLIDSVRTPPLAADDPLLHLLVDSRKPKPLRSDNLWLRLVDVDRALAVRGYAVDIDVVIEVSDSLCPWNARRWRLAGDATGATCAATTDPAEVSVDVRELGAAYVGGTSLAALAMAGLVEEHRPGAVAQLSAALRSAVEPVSPYVF